MGRSHALSGALGGVGVVAVVPGEPWPVALLAIAVTGGAALLPDLDHPPSTAARSLGPLTRLLARFLGWLSLVVYQATRGDGDQAGRQSGHRLATHTVPGCLLAGGLVYALGSVSPVALAVACGLLAGLLGLGLQAAGFASAVAGAAVSYWCGLQYPGWSWLFAVCVSLGCLVHVAGDSVTSQGVPVAWPLLLGDERWRFLSTPVTFPAGGFEEKTFVAPGLLVALVCSGVWVTGVGPAVWAAIEKTGGS
jgi:membrane-bound metal-dependent hydrolase YbcI (DUF457 family)